MISIANYLVKYPSGMRWYLMGMQSEATHVCTAMLKWADTDAHHLEEPFPGNYAFCAVVDASGEDYLQSNDEFFEENPSFTVDSPTTAKPVFLYMCGNDDASYSMFFATVEEAVETLNSLSEPVTLAQIKNLGFIV